MEGKIMKVFLIVLSISLVFSLGVMKKHEFYRKYANTPLNLRSIPLSMINNPITLNQIYNDMKTHDDAIRVEEKAQSKKILLAEEIWNNLDL